MNRSLFNWRRMVKEFFLREINVHRCTRFNLSRGSAPAMRMLRQEAGDVEEAPLPEHEVVGDEKVAETPEHEVDGDVEVGEKKVAPGTSTRLFNRCDGCRMDKSEEYMMHICGYFADDGADVGGEGCGSVVPATREEVAHAPCRATFWL